MASSSRILYILERLLHEQSIKLSDVAKDFGVSVRSLQRDMKDIKEYFGDSLDNSVRGEYRLIGNSTLKEFISSKNNLKELKDFFELLVILDSPFLNHISVKEFPFLRSIKRETIDVFKLCDSPVEEYIDSAGVLADAKKAIKNRQYIDLVYDNATNETLAKVQPYKILYAKGNLYLVIKLADDSFNGGLRLLRVSFVKKIVILRSTFQKDPQIVNFLDNIQTLFTSYGASDYEVVVLALPNIAKFFRNKKHLKSQQILSDDSDGLKLSYKINNPMEIIPLVKTWLPDLIILSPEHIKKKMADITRVYQERIDKFS